MHIWEQGNNILSSSHTMCNVLLVHSILQYWIDFYARRRIRKKNSPRKCLNLAFLLLVQCAVCTEIQHPVQISCYPKHECKYIFFSSLFKIFTEMMLFTFFSSYNRFFFMPTDANQIQLSVCVCVYKPFKGISNEIFHAWKLSCAWQMRYTLRLQERYVEWTRS